MGWDPPPATEEALREADCWFKTDRVPGHPDVTAFKRAARWRQHRWAVECRGVTEFGTHRTPETKKAPSRTVGNGTKLTDPDVARNVNFLSASIADAAKARAAEKVPNQTLDATRLRRDLLSSMPMAFNLFGEAASQPASAEALRDLLAPGTTGPVEVRFEWSPERKNPRYTNDRTAFDVALVIGTGQQTVVGIETKYHEHAGRDPEARPEQEAHLTTIAERSGVFRAGWQDAVLRTELRQIWRDHLLALSMRSVPAEWTADTRYVLAAPRRNPSFADVARRYREVLVDSDTSFRAVDLEDLVDAAFAHGGPTRDAFCERYLW